MDIDFIKKFEGFSARSYKDGSGRYSIGYGSKHEAWMPNVITEGYANGLLEAEIKEIQNELLKRGYNFTGDKETAIVSFLYNTGAWGSDLFEKLGNDEGFEWWQKHYITSDGGKENKGLENRRIAEAQLFYGKINNETTKGFSILFGLLLIVVGYYYLSNEKI